MTDYYVDSGAASSAEPYDTWAKAAASVQLVLEGTVDAVIAGDRIFVLNTNDQDAAANLTWPFPASSEVNPVLIISTSDTGNAPPLTYVSGALQGQTLGAAGTFDVAINPAAGEAFVTLGVGIVAEDNFTTAARGWSSFNDCIVQYSDNAATGARAGVSYTNVEFYFVDTGHTLYVMHYGGAYLIRNCSLHASSAAITDFIDFMDDNETASCVIDGFDLSGAATGFELVSAANVYNLRITGSGILLPTSGTVCDGTINSSGCIDIRGISSTAASLHGVFYKTQAGTVTEDSTTYLDATYDGTNGYSLCFTPTASAIKGLGDPQYTLRYDICEVWCDANPTITVHMTSDTGSMGNQSIWLEIEHPDATSAVLRTITSTLNAHKMLGTDAALTDDSAAAWTSGKTNDYSIASTLSSSAGVVKVFVCVANSATTPVLFVDPAVDIT